MYLDGIVALVDAYHVQSQLEVSELGLEAEATKQLACADVLVLNKVDLVSEAQLQQGVQTLREINPTARRGGYKRIWPREAVAEPLRRGVGPVWRALLRAEPRNLGEILGLQAFDKDRGALSASKNA